MLASFDQRVEDLSGHRLGTVFGMTGDTNGAAAQALDAVLAVAGLHFQQTPGRQIRTIYELG